MNYSALAATASRLIGDAGQTVTFSRYSPEVDGITGRVIKGIPLTSLASAIVLPASSGTGPAFDNRLEELSTAGKQLRFLKVAAQGMTFEPRSLDEVTFDGSTWQVLGCTPINPAGTALVYGVGVVRL